MPKQKKSDSYCIDVPEGFSKQTMFDVRIRREKPFVCSITLSVITAILWAVLFFIVGISKPMMDMDGFVTIVFGFISPPFVLGISFVFSYLYLKLRSYNWKRNDSI